MQTRIRCGSVEVDLSEDTKQMLARVYAEILSEGGTQTITVKDIVARAGVSRMTFYYHFSDIYDLVYWTYRRRFGEVLRESLAEHGAAGILERVVYALAREGEGDSGPNMLENYQHLDRNVLDRLLSRFSYDVLSRCADIDPLFDSLESSDREFLIRMTTFAIAGMVSSQLNHDLDADASEYLLRYFKLLNARLRELR